MPAGCRPRLRGLAPAWALAPALGLAALVAGCSAPEETVSGDPPPAAETLAAPDVAARCAAALPDLARVGESVQAQIREYHAALPPRDARAGLPPSCRRRRPAGWA